MDTLFASAPVVTLLPRTPALHGFIIRRCFAENAQGERATVIASCKAELAWASAEWRRLNHWRGWDHEAEMMAEGDRLPHEQAAARVLNVWGHLHPVENRLRECVARLRKHREAGPPWAQRAAGTERDIQDYWTERRRLVAAFCRAVGNYRVARQGVL